MVSRKVDRYGFVFKRASKINAVNTQGVITNRFSNYCVNLIESWALRQGANLNYKFAKDVKCD